MNMHFFPGSDNSTPDLDDDDPDRQSSSKKITVFYRNVVSEQRYHQGQAGGEYGFELGYVQINTGDNVLRTKICETVIKILETTKNPDIIIKNIFRNNLS